MFKEIYFLFCFYFIYRIIGLKSFVLLAIRRLVSLPN